MSEPVCETCGKTTCPDAALPAFSEPRDCTFAPIYFALRDAKDCDYGCSRDYTNQAIRLWVVEAVEEIVAAEIANLTRWKEEALQVISGLQKLGRALDLPLGVEITGSQALEAVSRLKRDAGTRKRMESLATGWEAMEAQCTHRGCGHVYCDFSLKLRHALASE